MKIKYIIIIPARNEEQYIEKTINSVIKQTIKPTELIIVNDGSTDNTKNIVEKYSKKYNWIKLVNRKNRGFRKLGGGVVETFYAGYKKMKTKRYDFIVKLDGDLSFDKNYFKQIFKKFKEDSELGIASGHCYVPENGKLRWERTNTYHTRGGSKVYRKKCFDDIGGLIVHLGWDTVDEIRAQMLGWKIKSYKRIKVIHHRPTASSTGLWIKGKFREGKISHYLGYHPLFIIARGIRQLFEKPFFVGGLFLIIGYFVSNIRNEERIKDRKFLDFLRKQQLKRLGIKR